MMYFKKPEIQGCTGFCFLKMLVCRQKVINNVVKSGKKWEISLYIYTFKLYSEK